MKRVLGFILTFILILNTAVTPGISARAQNADEDGTTRPAAMRRADKILGLQQYDEYFIGESDAKVYRKNLNKSYPASYLVEEAESRWGYTSLMSVINFANNEDFRSHPEYYYEAALMSLLFEQMNDQSCWDSNEQEVDKETINIAKDLLGTAVGAETDALEELKKFKKTEFTDEQYLNALKGLQGLQNAETVLSTIVGYATDALEVVQYAESLQKILSLQEEIIDFLEEMKERTYNEHLITALDMIVDVYRTQQQDSSHAIHIVVGLQAGEMAMSRIMQNSLDALWEGLCVAFPELKVIELAFSIEGFVLEQVFCPDAISDAYAKLAAIWELEKVARDAVYDLGLEYSQSCGSVTEDSKKLAGVFNTGWDFFTILLDADCQASLLFAKATYNAGLHSILESFSGGDDYKEFAAQVKVYQDQLCVWKNDICMYMEGLKPENRKVSGAVFPEKEVELEPGETYALNLEVIPADAKDNYVDYRIVTGNDDSGDENSYDPVKENNVVRIEGNKLTAISYGTARIEGIAGDCGANDVLTVHVALGGISENGLIFRVDENNEAIITGYEGTASKVEIPSYISNSKTDTVAAMYPVTKVEKFTGQSGKNTTVQEVVLPSSVTEIDEYAFYQCTAMKKINLENVARIGEYAFGYCSSLEEVTLKQSEADVTRVGGFAFAYCTSLRKIDLSGILLANIPEGFCYKCTGLKTILWPPNVQRIRYWAFYDCGFEELELPDTISWLEASAVAQCKNLKILVLPYGIVEVDPDPLKFINADDTVYYVEQYSYIHRRLEQWNNAMGYDFHIEYIKYLTTPKPPYTISDDSTDSTDNSSDPSGGSASSGGGKKDQSAIKAKNIKKTKKSKKIKTATVGKTVQLKVKLSPANATEKPVWTSGKPKVATVSPDGKVTPKKKGETKITARIANGRKVTWKIKVKELKAKKISLNKKKATLHAGETLQLKTKLKPKGSTAKIKWKSSKKKVATVSQNGTVTARKKGKAVITAQLPNGRKAKCKITVKKAAPQNGGSTDGSKNNGGNTGASDGQNHTGGSTTGDSSSVTQPGGDTGNRPGTNPGGGSGTPGDNQNPGGEGQNPGDSDTPGGGSQNPGDSDISDGGSQNPGDSQNPGGDGSDEENVPTKLTLATNNLTLKGRWQTITLSAGEETDPHVGDEVKLTAEPDSFYGDSQILDAEITEGNDMQRIHWTSADETIVKVYNGGLIRGVRTGTTTVTATTTDGTTAKCRVTVAEADLEWKSSDTGVAEISSVDDDGRTAHITAGKEGTADITVCSGSYQSTCCLTVSADSTDPEKPTDPTDSTEPTEPTDPTDSTEPTGPTDPDDSDDPVNPDAKPISTVEDLKAIVNNLDGDYILTKDLNLNEENWTPIGTQEAPFTGTLDGDGHTIEGLAIKGDSFSAAGEYYYGLFGVMEGASQNEAAKVCDLTIAGNIALEGSITQTVQTDAQNIQWIFRMGAFAGNADNWSIFENCVSQTTITVDVTAREDTDAITIYAGGTSGGGNTSNNIFFKECVNKGNIRCKVTEGKTAGMYIGGITGRGVTNIAMDHCQNDGDIYASGQTQQGINVLVGGMAGELLLYTNIVQQCKNQGDVIASADMKADTSLTGDYCIAGGIIGRKGKNVNITDSVNIGTVKASSVNQIIQVHYGSIYGKINQ